MIQESVASRISHLGFSLAILLMGSVSITSAADWPMRGFNSSRNAVIPNADGPTEWRIADRNGISKNVRWIAKLGYNSQGGPVISGGLVWVGTNHLQTEGDPIRDAAVLMCFDEKDGQLLYKYLSRRLPEGRDGDWPGSSLSASPLIEDDRLWICTNRCEVLCFDIGPLLKRTGEPRVIWKVDMRQKFGVVPRAVMIASDAAQCSIASYRDLIYVNTTNACGYRHHVPAPDAPSLICFNKRDGSVKWKDNSPGKNLLDVQHGSPLVAEIDGIPQVIMGQGDGWVRGFDALTGAVLWKFEINSKSAKRDRNFWASKLNNIVTMPVLSGEHIYFATGRHADLVGVPANVCCLDPKKRGDISREISADDGQTVHNPNSGLVWEYTGMGTMPGDIMSSSLSSVVVHQGLLIVPDTEGLVHCVDATTGKGLWIHDSLDRVWCSPIIIGSKIYIGAEGGLTILELARQKKLIAEFAMDGLIDATPSFANGVLYVMTRNSLFAIQQ